MLKVIPVLTLEEAQIVRSIRNSAREQMTNNNTFINPDDQERWYNKLDSVKNKLYLYQDTYGCYVGFGYLTLRDRWYATLALYPEFRGFGFGTWIYTHLLSIAPDTLWIEIFSDNNPSLVAALKAGFTIHSITDKTIVLSARTP